MSCINRCTESCTVSICRLQKIESEDHGSEVGSENIVKVYKRRTKSGLRSVHIARVVDCNRSL